MLAVAPLVGAWIEISTIYTHKSRKTSRSPCGSVDWNTSQQKGISVLEKSLPLWERGLK